MKFSRHRFVSVRPVPGMFESREAVESSIASRVARSAFTLVEVALSLAVIGFGLVAILGVMPIGVQVQKDNREETIIQQDGLYLLEAIRSGSRGLDELTNYFDRVLITNWVRGAARPTASLVYMPGNPAGSARRITNSQHLISLLSTPKVMVNERGEVVTNIVVAHVRSISGVASEKSLLDPNVRDFAFRYQLRSEVVPFGNVPEEWLASRGAIASAEAERLINLRNNLRDVRLTISWPLFVRGNGVDVGFNRKSFRTLVSGATDTNLLLTPNQYATTY